MNQLIETLAHKDLEHRSKFQVQELTIDYLQFLKFEIAKAVSANHGVLDSIVSYGIKNKAKPFVIRPLRNLIELDKFEMTDSINVNTQNKMKWYLSWVWNRQYPTFITYVATKFTDGDKLCRHIDIDRDEMMSYCDVTKFDEYIDLIKKHNMGNGNGWLIPKDKVLSFQSFLQEASDRIRSSLGTETPEYSGNGFRVLLKGTSKEIMKEKIDGWKEAGLVDIASTMDTHAMRLNSVQTLKPHFQTDIAPTSPYFRYSNPAFFHLRFDNDKIKVLNEYYRAWLTSGIDQWEYADDKHVVDKWGYYTDMRDKQVEYEKVIKSWLTT